LLGDCCFLHFFNFPTKSRDFYSYHNLYLKRYPPKLKISVNHGSKNIRALNKNIKPHQNPLKHSIGTLNPSEPVRELKRNPPKFKISANHGSKNIRELNRNLKTPSEHLKETFQHSKSQ